MKCPSPSCEVDIADDDTAAQRAHLEAEHPEIIAERLAEFHRWDGWVDE